MSNFKVQIHLPYDNVDVFVKQFTNADYKVIIKTLLNKNGDAGNVNIDKIISKCIDCDISRLNIIDKFVVLLNLRCISVDDKLVHTIEKDKSKYNINYSVYDVLNRISKMTFDKPFTTTYKLKNTDITMTAGLPDNLFFDVTDIYTFVRMIKIGNNFYDLNRLSNKEREDIINYLPGKLVTTLLTYVSNVLDNIRKTELISIRTNMETKESESIKFYLDKTNMFTLLQLFFNESLTNIMIKQFLLSKQYNISCEYFDMSPPIETEIMYGFHKEIEQQAEQSKKNTNPTINSISYGEEMG